MEVVIETGGKQYRVQEGSRIRIEKVAGKVGETVTLGRIVAAGSGDQLKVGRPNLSGKVTGEIVQQGLAKKVIVFKKRRRKRYRRLRGHRQSFTTLLIKEIRMES